MEIKPTPGFEVETGKHVAHEAARLWAGAKVAPLLSSFSYEALMAAKEAAPALPRGWLADKLTREDWPRLKALEAVSFHTDHRKLALADISRLRDAGYRVMVYTVNDVGAAEKLLEAGVDGLFTDNLRVFAGRFPEAIAGRVE